MSAPPINPIQNFIAQLPPSLQQEVKDWIASLAGREPIIWWQACGLPEDQFHHDRFHLAVTFEDDTKHGNIFSYDKFEEVR
jgi:hypothetical protein